VSLVINEVGAEQSLYFQQLYEVEKMLGWYTEGQRVHVKHGMYRFKDMKMSTRKGNVIWLEDVLEEARKKALELTNGMTSREVLILILSLTGMIF
jgi:arginyl-tRNA synthetase